MRLVINGRDLPGRSFGKHGNVHVGTQLGRDPADLVPGDATSASWALDVRVVVGDGGGLDFRGPAVQGKRGERFVYLTWGDVDGDGPFTMFRRLKLMLADVDPGLVDAAESGAGALTATLGLSDEHGCPRCARVVPPQVTWTVE